MKDSNTTAARPTPPPDRESWTRPGAALPLRLSQRLLACNTYVENHLRSKLRNEFGTTLPRFDLMAQLSNAPTGMKMSDLSRHMMVTNGNITGITDQLVNDCLVERVKPDSDRRSCLLRLTPKGRQNFRRMATAYEGWVTELFAGMDAEKLEALYLALGEFKTTALAADTEGFAPADAP